METITLDYPVEHKGQTYAELHMRRPRVGDMVLGDKRGGTDLEKELILFATLCEVPPAVLEGLDMKDYRKVQERYTGFLS
ncbi:hypothetical protein GGQ74_000844 [Desulfobaculum xiamenense]|uniref:Phage tail assembly chaperone protein, E, or 41 or 14 n=1 Tax=Desulfobaculum xiamenense TaxID=995050 RepID=A0A846QPR2_9BACT|nr:phage tail assembly protein [Desulfobaculum xiamenense]NJB67204.1 hypothetical protein [Desulfobaculum xiamenense]